MNYSSGLCSAIKEIFMRSRACLYSVMGSAPLVLSASSAFPQPVDCPRLAAQINALGAASQRPLIHYGSAVQKQRAELDREIKNARALGCNRGQFFLFDTAPPQCSGLNARIQQLQASLAHDGGNSDLGGNTAARQQLVARYNAYCRGQARGTQLPGFLEQLFGALAPNSNPVQPPQFEELRPPDGADLTPHGGSQAVCVRECDGGFFPLNLSVANSDPDQLTGLCQALCPNAPVSVYTRAPFQEISTAVSLDGDSPYSDLPNALKFEKNFDPACTCKPPGVSWAEALAGAEEMLGRARKSDIVVTPESSAELAKPAIEKAGRPGPGAPAAAGQENQAGNNPAGAGKEAGTGEVTGPDGVKRRVRIIVPPL
jgi:hypothetical protein